MRWSRVLLTDVIAIGMICLEPGLGHVLEGVAIVDTDEIQNSCLLPVKLVADITSMNPDAGCLD